VSRGGQLKVQAVLTTGCAGCLGPEITHRRGGGGLGRKIERCSQIGNRRSAGGLSMLEWN